MAVAMEFSSTPPITKLSTVATFQLHLRPNTPFWRTSPNFSQLSFCQLRSLLLSHLIPLSTPFMPKKPAQVQPMG